MNLMQLLGGKSKATLGGRYKLIQPLGQGGFGHTFLANDLHLPDHPTCVIKQLKPHLQDAESFATARRLFETEARVLYQLGEHNQIPRLLAHFEDGQEFYLAQELVEGDSLANLIRPGQPWSEARVRRLLTEILTPLAFVHDQGVIHRDLKPSNLIHRRADDHMVLIDFGAVKQVSERRIRDSNGNITRTISIGTQGYMPSEQLAGNPWFSSDIYAAGMVCLQALTGTAPHRLRRDSATSEIIWQSPDLDISSDFKAILVRMVRYDFRERYATAAEVLRDLALLPALPAEPLVMQSGDTDSSVPTQVVAPAKPSSGGPSSPTVASHPPLLTTESATRTLAVEKLGRPVVSQSLPTLTKATVAAAPSLLSKNPMGRWSMVGLAVVTVGVLGGLRHGQPANNMAAVSQPVEISPPVEASPSAPAPVPRPSVEAVSPPAPPLVSSDGVRPPEQEAESARQQPKQPAVPKPPSVDELLERAQELRDRNQYDDALQVYDQLLEQDSDQPEAHWGQCYSLNQLQDYGQAIKACDLALALSPVHSQALLSKGYALEQQGQPQAALDLYDQILELDPDYIDAWNNRGGILFNQQRFEAALAAFDRARDIDPGFAEAWNNRGAALWELRRFDDAIASIDQAIALQPDYTDAQNLREQIRQKLGR